MRQICVNVLAHHFDADLPRRMGLTAPGPSVLYDVHTLQIIFSTIYWPTVSSFEERPASFRLATSSRRWPDVKHKVVSELQWPLTSTAFFASSTTFIVAHQFYMGKERFAEMHTSPSPQSCIWKAPKIGTAENGCRHSKCLFWLIDLYLVRIKSSTLEL